MSYFQSFQDVMNEDNAGIDFPVDRLNSIIPGIQKQRIYVAGAGSGVGKTKFTLEFFVFNTFDDWYFSDRTDSINIHVFSLEVPKEEVIASLAARWLYKQHKILVDYGYILNYWKKYPMTEYVKDLLKSDEFKLYLEKFEETVKILDFSLNTVSFAQYVDGIAKEQGEILTKQVVTKDNVTLNMFESYTPVNKDTYNIFVLDHIGLVKTISGQDKRKMIEDIADYQIKARNRYRFTFCNTQQLNRGSNSVERHKLEDLIVKDSDFAGGSGLFNAANVVIGLMSPNREQQSSFMGFRVANSDLQPGLGNRLTVLNVVKNRHGSAFGVLPMLFLGEIGLYSALPRDPEGFDYNQISNIKKYYE